MTHLARTTTCLITASTLLLLAACGNDSGDTATSGSGSGDAGELTISGAGEGGTFYEYAQSFATVVDTELPDVSAEALTSGGSVENVRLVAQGYSDIGIAQADVAYEAYHGGSEFTSDMGVRVIAALYPNYLQLATPSDSGIRHFTDLEGASVSVGPAGGGQEVTLRTVLHALGYTFDHFGEIHNYGFVEQNDAFTIDEIDVGNYMTAMGAGTLIDLSTTRDITFVQFEDEELDTIIEREPYFSRGAILGSIYDSIDDNIPVPTLWNYFLVSEDMDDDLVYDLTSTLYEHARTVESTTPQAFETSLNNVEHILVPLHPGAARYFREQGIEIPEPAQPD
jgi:uncharacterized protein